MPKDTPPEAMEGVESSNHDSDETPLFTEKESQLLELYDRLEQLQLEIAYLKAQGVISQEEPKEVTEEEIKVAQEELMKAKATYQLRKNIVENILTAAPILNAVHAGPKASVYDKDLLPLLERRDDLSFSLSKISTETLSARTELIKVSAEHIKVARENAELAKEVMALAKELEEQKSEDITDPELRRQVEEARKEMEASQKRYRIMKAVASGVVVGSGVDWARDERLLEIVRDRDDDGFVYDGEDGEDGDGE